MAGGAVVEMADGPEREGQGEVERGRTGSDVGQPHVDGGQGATNARRRLAHDAMIDQTARPRQTPRTTGKGAAAAHRPVAAATAPRPAFCASRGRRRVGSDRPAGGPAGSCSAASGLAAARVGASARPAVGRPGLEPPVGPGGCVPPPPSPSTPPEHVRRGAAAGGKHTAQTPLAAVAGSGPPRAPRGAGRRGAPTGGGGGGRGPHSVASSPALRGGTTLLATGHGSVLPRTQDAPPVPAAAAAPAGQCAGRPPALPRVCPAAPNTPRGCAPHGAITPHRDRWWVPERAGGGGGGARGGSGPAAVASGRSCEGGWGGHTGKGPVGRQASCGRGGGHGRLFDGGSVPKGPNANARGRPAVAANATPPSGADRGTLGRTRGSGTARS